MNCLVEVMCEPSEREMGMRSADLSGSSGFGIKSTSVFDLLALVPVCIWRPNRFKWFSTRFSALAASARVGRMKALSSKYSESQWVKSYHFVFVLWPVILPLSLPALVFGKNLYTGLLMFDLHSSVSSSDSIAAWKTSVKRRGARLSP